MMNRWGCSVMGISWDEWMEYSVIFCFFTAKTHHKWNMRSFHSLQCHMASVEVESVDYFRQLTEKELHDVASQRIFGGFIMVISYGYIMVISWVYRGKCGFEEDDLARKTVTHKNQRGICGYGIPQGNTHTPSKNCIFLVEGRNGQPWKPILYSPI